MRRSRVAISLCLKIGGKAALHSKFFFSIFLILMIYYDAKFDADYEFIWNYVLNPIENMKKI